MRKKAVLTKVIVLVLFLGGLMMIRHVRKIPFSLDDSRIKKLEVSCLTEDGVKKKTLTGAEKSDIIKQLNALPADSCKLRDPGKGWEVWIKYSDNGDVWILGNLLVVDGFLCRIYEMPENEMNDFVENIKNLCR